MWRFVTVAMTICIAAPAISATVQRAPEAAKIDAHVRAAMAETGAKGLALAVPSCRTTSRGESLSCDGEVRPR